MGTTAVPVAEPIRLPRSTMARIAVLATASAFAIMFAQPFVNTVQTWWSNPEAGHGLSEDPRDGMIIEEARLPVQRSAAVRRQPQFLLPAAGRGLNVDEGQILRRIIAVENRGDPDITLRGKAGERRPVELMLDLQLPDLSGGEVLRQLKASRSTRDIPVAIVTSLDLDEEAAAALTRQGATVLSKSTWNAEAMSALLQRAAAAHGMAEA